MLVTEPVAEAGTQDLSSEPLAELHPWLAGLARDVPPRRQPGLRSVCLQVAKSSRGLLAFQWGPHIPIWEASDLLVL